MINLRKVLFCLAFPLFNLNCGASSEVVSDEGKNKNPKTETHNERNKQEDKRKRDKLAEKKEELLRKHMDMIKKVTERLKTKQQKEVDELIQSYIDSRKDLSDPDNALELENEIKKISQKYF